jgi:GAF domain-containing protein/CheY-like chemotaxis protein
MRSSRPFILKGRYTCLFLGSFILSFLFPLLTKAQPVKDKGLPFITNYRFQDYNADGVNWWATEDDKGVIYFANAVGVLVYDGQQWELIKLPGVGETRSLAKGSDGKMYVGGNGSIGYLAPAKNGKLEFVSLNDKIPEQHRTFSEVWETIVGNNKLYFVCSDKIFIWDYKSFLVLESNDGFHDASNVNDHFYVRIWNRGLTELKSDSFHVVPNGEKFANERIYAMLPYDQNRMLVGTRTKGLFIYDGKDFTAFKTEADPYIVNTSLYGGLVLSTGHFAINTFNNGMVIIDRRGKLIQKIDKSVGIRDNSIDFLFEDSKGILWMPLFNGISKFDLKSSLTYYDESFGLPAKTVFSVGVFNDIVYAGTNNGAYMLNKANNRFELVQGTSGQVFTFTTNGSDFLISGAEKGLQKINGGKAYPVIPGINYDFHVRQVIRSKFDTTSFFIDLRSGLAIVRYNKLNGKYTVESFRDDINTSLGLLSETNNGDIWVLGDKPGQLKLVKPKRTADKISLTEAEIKVYDHSKGLPVKQVFITNYGGTIYFTSAKDSIFVFDEKKDRFVRDTSSFIKNHVVTDADGTTDMPIDHLGRIWANYGAGVFVKIPGKDDSSKIVDAPFREMKKNFPVWSITPVVDKNGNQVVWFAGREGIIRYDGNLDETSPGTFHTIIRKITLNEDSVFYSGFDLPGDKTAFSNNWNTVRFQYAAPFFKSENETVFSTYLEGRDKNWSEWTKQSFRELGNLPAGTYTFRVKARNIYDIESDEASFKFIVLPPWYASWWAYALYAMAAIVLIGLIVRYRTRQLEAKHKELEKTVALRTAELSHRVEELAVINSVQEGLVREMGMQDIYDMVGEKIREIFNAQVIDIVTYDSKTNLMEDRYAYEKGDRTLLGPREPQGFRKHIIETKEPLVLNKDIKANVEKFGHKILIGEEAKSVALVPMISGGEVKGIISLQDIDKENAFPESSVSLLTTLANSMSVALESARRFDETNRLLKETEQRNAELAVINSVQDGLVSEMDIQGIYYLVGEKIREIFDAQVIDIVTYDRETNLIEDKYAYEKGDATLLGPREPTGFRKHIIETGEQLVINENATEAGKKYNNKVIVGEDPKSLVMVPMITSGQVTGIISLQNVDHEHAFSDSNVRLINTLANSMSIALESARLFDETKRLLKETEQRNAELGVINSVQEGLVAQMNIQGIYDLVGEKIRQILNAEVIDIVTYDKKTHLIEDRYSFEKGDRTLLGPREPNGFRKHVIDTRQVLVINKDVDKHMQEYGNEVLIGATSKSNVFVPLLSDGEVTGIISIQDIEHENAFSDSDVSLISTLANSMSIALKSARLFDETNRLLKETEQRNAELGVINSVQDGLVRKMDMQGIYELVGEKIREIFDAQVIDIVTYDQKSHLIADRYSYEKGDRTLVGPRKPSGFRKHIIETGKELILHGNIEKYSREYNNPVVVGEIAKSAVFVPMVNGGLVSGIISLQNLDHENAFSESDVRLITTLSNSMSIALESARLFDETKHLLKETEQRNAELAVINSVQDGLVREMDIQGIYYLVGEKIREIFDAQVIDIVTYDRKTNLIEDKYSYEKGDRTLVGPREPGGFRKHIIETGEQLVINENADKAGEKYDNKVVVGETPKSLVLVPMITSGQVSGIISLQNVDHENAFSDSNVRLINTLANSMSIALESARLFDETKRLLKETEQRNAELAVINSVQEGLVREMDIQGIYYLVGEKIREIFDAQVIDIVTYDRTTNLIEDKYAFEKGDRTLLGQREPKGFRKYVIKTGELLLHNENVAGVSKQFDNEVLIGEMAKSQIFYPLMAGGKVNGIISLQNLDHEQAFSESDVNLLATLANSMSVALESARLFDETNRLLKETEQRNAELAVINSVQESLVAQMDMQGIYELVGEKMREIFNAQVIDIVTYDKKTNLIEDKYSFEKGDRTLLGPRSPKGFRNHVIQSGQLLVINKDVEKQRSQYDNTVIVGQAAKSLVLVPMVAGGEVNGVISLQNLDQENAFSESDISLLVTLVNSMSVALKSARLFDETKRLLKETEQRKAELAVINNVQEGLVKEFKSKAIYELVGEKLCELFDTQTVIIRTFEHETGLEVWRYAIEKGKRQYSEPRPMIWANKRLVQTHKPLLINENYLEISKKYGGSGVSIGQPPKSAVFVPMIVGDVVRGSVSLQNVDKENAFTEAELGLLTTLTSSMGVALENARLFDETTRLLDETNQRATELSTVNNISQTLASQLNPEDLIKLVGDQLRDLFKANVVYLALLDTNSKIIYFPYQYGDDLTPMKLGEGLTSQILLTGKPLLINKDVDEQTIKLGVQRLGIPAASYLGVPIPVGDEIIGVLSVQSTESENRFNENDQRLLSTIAASVGVALRKAQLFEEVILAKQQAEEASKTADKANQAKSAFLSTVSHELRTPLTSVLGFAKIIKKRLEEKIFPVTNASDPKTEKTIHQISDNLNVVISEGERLTNLINEVLDLAKIEAGKMEWNMETVSMQEIADRALAATTSLFEQKNLELKSHIQENLPAVMGDRDKLIQVMVNLISNAVKFTPTGTITCTVTRKRNEIITGITDTGIGIAPSDHAAVFEQFKQVVGDTLTDKPKGTGLGLPICKEIVEHHGGRIWLESELGKGSTFYFAIPVQKTNAGITKPIHLNDLVKQLKEQMAQSQLNSKGRNATILVVDDDDSIRSLLEQELGDAGYIIEQATNGKEALASVRNHKPDLIILDVMMPEMNGFDVAAILKNDPNTMDIPIIVLSIVQDKARGFRIGVDRYLTKPIDTAQLFTEVGSLLEQGKSKKKVMVVDEDKTAVSTLTDVLQAKGYQVVESDGKELVEKAILNQPDIIILNSVLSDKSHEIVQSLRFEKGLENVLFLIYQ